MSCDPQTLLTQANCFQCLTPGELALVKVALLCNIAGGGESNSVASFNRPNDNTGYIANDAVGTSPASVLVFPGMARANGGSGIIREVKMATDLASFAGTTLLNLYLFTKPPTPTIDNAPLVISLADNLNWVLKLAGGAFAAEAAGSTVVANFTAFTAGYACDPGDTALYGLLGYSGAGNTPGPNQLFQITITAELL